MKLPDNWEEEVMLHSWKMMKIERCRHSDSHIYIFPNKITVRGAIVFVDIERARAVEALLEEFEYEKKVKDNIVEIKLKHRKYEKEPMKGVVYFFLTKGNYEEFLWNLYAIDSGFE